MKIALKCALLTALTFFLANQAFANPCPPGNPPTNCAPPPGAILDLTEPLSRTRIHNTLLTLRRRPHPPTSASHFAKTPPSSTLTTCP
jgi:hypothetical protein